ncbi:MULTISPECIES: hypothetical protein [Sphingopyxis]|uniref:hypothetical protein n=1 Tax=Sphingopyxis TaxID=165697 RepID=UPI0015CD1624|nr:MULTISPECIES: hypothetical protein [Sphingopyxis]NYF31277.1 hypothetical protein [Sphingopyxis sp. JAI108]
MRAYMGTPVALALASFATAAHAECVPSFVAGGNSVALTPAGSFEDGQLNERFLVRLRNDGDTICELRLAVGRDIAASDPSFPKFELFGPNGAVAIGDADGARSSARSAVDIVIPTGGETSIPYDVRMKLGWGFESGSYGQALEFFLLPRSGQAELGVQRTQLSLNIPAVARIRFAGAGNARGSASVEMGTLSPNAPSTSPPFAIRVLSTAGYQMDLQSENLGALRRIDGPEVIPYRMTVSGRAMNLRSGGDRIQVARHTGSTGNVHPVSVVVDPDPTFHAGNYRDRITVTVTPM